MILLMLGLGVVAAWTARGVPGGVFPSVVPKAPEGSANARFDLAFRPGASFVEEDPKTRARKVVPLVVREVGKVNLPSGRLSVADVGGEDVELVQKFPPGWYPLILSIARFKDDSRNALAMLRISDAKVARWKKAQCRFEGKGIGCSFGVDSGSAAFGSVEAWNREAEIMRSIPQDSVDKRIDEDVAIMMANRGKGVDYAEFMRDPKRQLNLIRVGTGFGDGAYGVYLGIDEKDQPVAVVADFGLADALVWPDGAPLHL